MKTLSSILILTTFALGSIAVQGVQLAQDGFASTDYTLAGIDPQGPAVSGFTGAWDGNGSIGATNLTYTSGSVSLQSGGYSYIRTDGAAVRPLDVSTTGPFAAYLNTAQTDIGGDNAGTIYGSFLMTSPNTSFSGFIELNNGGARSFRLGINNGAWSRRIAGGGWGTLDGAPAVVAGVTNLVVYSITFDRGDGRAAIDVWINPAIGAGTPAPTSSFDVGDVIAFDDVEMALYFAETAYMDEIRFGESFADVTPFNAPFNTVYEGFAAGDYSVAAINTQGPVVSGFTSAWSGVGGISGTNLTYSSGSATLETVGYSYVRNGGTAVRPLDLSPSGPFADFLNTAETDIGGDNAGTIYGSFLMTSPNTSFSGWIELNNGGVRSFALGINNGVWSRRIAAGGSWSGLAGAPAVVAGVTNLVVYSITFDRGDGRADIDVWINPTIGAGTPGPTSSFDVGDVIAFDDVEMALWFSQDAYMDEIRFGDSFAAVTPSVAALVIPFPAIVPVGGTHEISFASESGLTYTLESDDDLAGPWTDVPGVAPIIGDGGAKVFTVNPAPALPVFYRINVE